MGQGWRSAGGFALSELLVALAVTGLVLTAIGGLLEQGQRVYLAGAAQLEAQQSARVAVERLARELRGAGVDPRGAGFVPLLNPGPTGFTIQNDLNGDGVIAEHRETITYSLTGRTLRRSAGGGAQPLIEGVESLAFTYLDGAGLPAATPRGIRTVLIAITVGPVSMTTQVRLRNR